MTSESSGQPSGGQSRPTPRAQPLAMQGLANRVVLFLLRAPMVSRGIGRRLVEVHVTGRKSGRHYTVPVAYTRHEGKVLIGTPFGWGRNLRTGQRVEIRLEGRLRQADVEAFTDEANVTKYYAIMCRDNRQFARFNKVGLGADGTPDANDLHLSWAAGARAFVLTPR